MAIRPVFKGVRMPVPGRAIRLERRAVQAPANGKAIRRVRWVVLAAGIPPVLWAVRVVACEGRAREGRAVRTVLEGAPAVAAHPVRVAVRAEEVLAGGVAR